jgi:exopolyphosphatase/guanosine-5'-triphosphate,3'-diphosphate pyrophosphatase
MRVAALDLGSNSFHVLIADVDQAGRLVVVERAKRMPRIGEGIFRTGSISSASRKSAFRALAELLPVVERHRPDVMQTVATAAVRDARNGPAFVAEVRARFGLDVRVISGDEEARLAYAGARALLGGELGHATLFDLGGGSLEAIIGDGRRIVRTASAPLGVLRSVVEQPLSDPPTPRELRALEQWTRDAVGAFLAKLGGVTLGRVILCAGTARAVRSVAQALGYVPTTGTGSDLVGRDTLRYLIDRLAARDARPGSGARRSDGPRHGDAGRDPRERRRRTGARLPRGAARGPHPRTVSIAANASSTACAASRARGTFGETPSISNRHESSSTSGFRALSASAISDSVPKPPPIAINASLEQTFTQFRASPRPV